MGFFDFLKKKSGNINVADRKYHKNFLDLLDSNDKAVLDRIEQGKNFDEITNLINTNLVRKKQPGVRSEYNYFITKIGLWLKEVGLDGPSEYEGIPLSNTQEGFAIIAQNSSNAKVYFEQKSKIYHAWAKEAISRAQKDNDQKAVAAINLADECLRRHFNMFNQMSSGKGFNPATQYSP